MIIVSAILFCPEEERPRIIAIQCCEPQCPSMDTCPQPVINFPDGQAESIIVAHGLNDRQLHYPLQLWYSPTASSRGAPINRPINQMIVGSEAKQWHDMVVVLKFSGSRRRGYSHASLNDLPDLAAYFLACKSK
ncbi:hypothetical protein SCLCIDRAFT_1220677 [Scleroderma citrinum Foug A]|uniref:Uncharacterized protein n=1 Tax=Scleroderma citrinum Foug A TaxID=1036808 RepID=A0A0C2ZU15_9AGAM|nr:hypothetical protein SCLCIDRAFT_1220677 [Scleroderma citrinum Foug A]